MHLIDNHILGRALQLFDVSPVKVIFDNPRMIDQALAALRPLSPLPLPGHGFGVRVQQNIVFVKKQSF